MPENILGVGIVSINVKKYVRYINVDKLEISVFARDGFECQGDPAGIKVTVEYHIFQLRRL